MCLSTLQLHDIWHKCLRIFPEQTFRDNRKFYYQVPQWVFHRLFMSRINAKFKTCIKTFCVFACVGVCISVQVCVYRYVSMYEDMDVQVCEYACRCVCTGV